MELSDLIISGTLLNQHGQNELLLISLFNLSARMSVQSASKRQEDFQLIRGAS